MHSDSSLPKSLIYHPWQVIERVHLEIKRWANLVGIFPDDVVRLVGAVLLEVHDDWLTPDRRYLSEGSRKEINTTTSPTPPPPNIARGRRGVHLLTLTAGCDPPAADLTLEMRGSLFS